MQRNLAHIASMAFNEPLLIEPAYARVFFSALGVEIGVSQIALPQQGEVLSAQDMNAVTAEFMSEGKRTPRFYQVRNGIAVLPVTGTLVHKLGAMRPFSGMTGYDGITARLEQAMSDPEVKGVLLDIDSPGGQVAGAFDCADMIVRMREQKPIWALSNDMACSAAMLLAAACTHRMTTQTGRMGSVGVLMAHTSIADALKKEGREVTLIYAGSHKVDGNPYEKLPESVRAEFQGKIEAARQMFAEKVAGYTGLSVQAVLDTEAAVYDGQAAVDIGFANEVVNSADAINAMASAMKNNTDFMGVKMSGTADAAAQERERIMGIMGCPAAKGREALASMLAGQPGISVEQAAGILAASPVVTGGGKAISDQIMDCDEAKGRETLATALAADPAMTLDKAKVLLAACPVAGAGDLRSKILACDEAKGRTELATALADMSGMTESKAKELLSKAPKATVSAGNDAFVSWMNANSIPAASSTESDESPEDASLTRLASFLGSKGEQNV